jgi:hypothetical protein
MHSLLHTIDGHMVSIILNYETRQFSNLIAMWPRLVLHVVGFCMVVVKQLCYITSFQSCVWLQVIINKIYF